MRQVQCDYNLKSFSYKLGMINKITNFEMYIAQPCKNCMHAFHETLLKNIVFFNQCHLFFMGSYILYHNMILLHLIGKIHSPIVN